MHRLGCHILQLLSTDDVQVLHACIMSMSWAIILAEYEEIGAPSPR